MGRILRLAIGALLVGFPAWMIYGMTIPVPKYRTGGYVDFLMFAYTLLAVYGGVFIGILIYWASQKRTGQRLSPLGIFIAGAVCSLAFSIAFVIGCGIYGLIVHGSFERGVGNLWGLIVIFWVLFGGVVAAGVGLLFFGLRGPTGPAGRGNAAIPMSR